MTRGTMRMRLAGFAALGLLAMPRAGLAAGAYAVDEAGVEVGECKVESWLSSASNRDLMAVATPACGFFFLRPFEIGAQLSRTRAEGEWAATVEPRLKIGILPVEVGRIGMAIVLGSGFDARTGRGTEYAINVPVAYTFSETFRITVNGGWLRERDEAIDRATFGAQFEWVFHKPFTLIGEVFGETAVADEPRTVRQPRMQAGLRFTPVESMDIDVIYGRNITGENASWITLGLNLRFQVLEKKDADDKR